MVTSRVQMVAGYSLNHNSLSSGLMMVISYLWSQKYRGSHISFMFGRRFQERTMDGKLECIWATCFNSSRTGAIPSSGANRLRVFNVLRQYANGQHYRLLIRLPLRLFHQRILRAAGAPGNGSPTYTGNSSPVKMVQHMVGRVRVSCVERIDRDVRLCVKLTFPFRYLQSLETRWQPYRSLVTPLLNPRPSYNSMISISFINRKDSLSMEIGPSHQHITIALDMPVAHFSLRTIISALYDKCANVTYGYCWRSNIGHL